MRRRSKRKSKVFLDFNKRNMSGAIDVIVVKNSDGKLNSSGFQVIFGKFKIFKPRDKVIDIYLNDQKTGLNMVLNGNGRA